MFGVQNIDQQVDPGLISHGTRIQAERPAIERKVHRGNVESLLRQQRGDRPERTAVASGAVDDQQPHRGPVQRSTTSVEELPAGAAFGAGAGRAIWTWWSRQRHHVLLIVRLAAACRDGSRNAA